MSVADIVNYVKSTPHNTNPNVIASMVEYELRKAASQVPEQNPGQNPGIPEQNPGTCPGTCPDYSHLEEFAAAAAQLITSGAIGFITDQEEVARGTIEDGIFYQMIDDYVLEEGAYYSLYIDGNENSAYGGTCKPHPTFEGHYIGYPLENTSQVEEVDFFVGEITYSGMKALGVICPQIINASFVLMKESVSPVNPKFLNGSVPSYDDFNELAKVALCSMFDQSTGINIKALPTPYWEETISLFDILASHEFKTLTGDNFAMSTVLNFRDYLTSSNTAHVYEPIQVRTADGSVIQPVACEVNLSTLGTAPIAFGYRVDGSSYAAITAEDYVNGYIEFPEQVYYIVPIRYDSVPIDLRIRQAYDYNFELLEKNGYTSIKTLPTFENAPESSIFDYLDAYELMTLTDANFKNSTLWNVLDVLTSSSTATIYEPIRVRRPDGTLIQTIKCEYASNYGSAPIVYYYDKYGRPIVKAGTSYVSNGALMVPEQAYFAVFIRYSTLELSLTARVKQSTEQEIANLKTTDEKIQKELNGFVGIKSLSYRTDSLASSLFDYLKSDKSRTLSNANFLASDLWNYTQKLTSSTSCEVFEPIRVRKPSGELIQKIYCNIDTARYGSAPLGFGYDSEGKPVEALRKENVTGGELTVPASVYFIVFLRYNTLTFEANTYLPEVSGGKIIHYTVGEGKQYTTLTECLRALKDNTDEKVIDIYSGTYDIYEEIGGADFITTLTGSENWQDVSDIVPDNTTIMGHGKVIIKMELPANVPNAVATLLSPINLMGSATLQNLTVKAANCRYCVHPEGSKLTQYNNAVWEIKDCKIYKTDTTLGSGNAIACGLNDGVFFKISNCVMTSVGDSCFSIHDNGAVYEVSPNVVFENCALSAKHYPLIFSANKRANMETVIEVLVANCYVKKGYTRKRCEQADTKDCFEVTYINSPHTNQHSELLIDVIPDIEYDNRV